MRLLSSIRLIRVALALVVAFWMAGAGCLLGCEKMIAAAAANEQQTATSGLTIVAEGDACASMQSHDCCARHSRKSAGNSVSKPASRAAQGVEAPTPTAVNSAVEVDATSSTMTDCPLAVNATAALTKARPDTTPVALAQAGVSAHLPSIQEHPRALSPPQLLLNRGHTYLHCCVFLI